MDRASTTSGREDLSLRIVAHGTAAGAAAWLASTSSANPNNLQQK